MYAWLCQEITQNLLVSNGSHIGNGFCSVRHIGHKPVKTLKQIYNDQIMFNNTKACFKSSFIDCTCVHTHTHTVSKKGHSWLTPYYCRTWKWSFVGSGRARSYAETDIWNEVEMLSIWKQNRNEVEMGTRGRRCGQSKKLHKPGGS